MGFSDALYDCIETLMDGIAHMYDEDEMLKEIPEDEDIIEFVALSLKLASKRLTLKTDTEGRNRIEALNWKQEAKKYIIQYLNEHHLE